MAVLGVVELPACYLTIPVTDKFGRKKMSFALFSITVAVDLLLVCLISTGLQSSNDLVSINFILNEYYEYYM